MFFFSQSGWTEITLVGMCFMAQKIEGHLLCQKDTCNGHGALSFGNLNRFLSINVAHLTTSGRGKLKLDWRERKVGGQVSKTKGSFACSWGSKKEPGYSIFVGGTHWF